MMRYTTISALLTTALAFGSIASANDEDVWTQRDAVNVRFTTGEVLEVRILELEGESLRLSHPILGEFTVAVNDIDLSSLERIRGEVEVIGEQPEGEALVEAEVEEGTEWKSKFLLGFSAESGNTENVNLNISVTTKRERETDRTSGFLRYFLGQEDGDTTSNKFIAFAIHEYLFPDSPWSLFVDGQYDYDQFNSWEHRVSSHVGPGYELINEEDLQLIVRAGAGFAKEFNSPRNEFIPEALIGAELDWQFKDNQSLTGFTTFFPDLDDTGEFRNLTGAEWTWKPERDNSLAINLGVYNEYQSKVTAGKENHDLRVYGGLSFDF